MSAKDGAEFDHLWADLNSLTKAEWDEIKEITRNAQIHGYFGGDEFKCAIGAFVMWFKDGNGHPGRDIDDTESSCH